MCFCVVFMIKKISFNYELREGALENCIFGFSWKEGACGRRREKGWILDLAVDRVIDLVEFLWRWQESDAAVVWMPGWVPDPF